MIKVAWCPASDAALASMLIITKLSARTVIIEEFYC